MVYEDNDKRGRPPGEMTDLISDGAAGPQAGPDRHAGHRAGGRAALRADAGLPADPVLLLYEELEPVREILAALGAARWPSAPTPSPLPAASHGSAGPAVAGVIQSASHGSAGPFGRRCVI